MFDAEISFARVEALDTARARRLPPLLGLGLGAVISLGLWCALGLTISHLL
ncbi:hypothetical protein [uncultured Caulobacter sp.]|uniref:hypothetical protein n=1 Tax=uncultured Caulobacter sp. TaxID=158749 RepID=UPI002619933C|nr:hypothetical protein [uncultured Caulobacter sp.]